MFAVTDVVESALAQRGVSSWELAAVLEPDHECPTERELEMRARRRRGYVFCQGGDLGRLLWVRRIPREENAWGQPTRRVVDLHVVNGAYDLEAEGARLFVPHTGQSVEVHYVGLAPSVEQVRAHLGEGAGEYRPYRNGYGDTVPAEGTYNAVLGAFSSIVDALSAELDRGVCALKPALS